MHIRLTEMKDLENLLALIDEARGTIARLGIDQWQDGNPSRAMIVEDIEKRRSYLVERSGQLCGTFALLDDGEPSYDVIYDGHWITGDDSRDYIAIHRVAVAVACRGQGISTAIMDHAAQYAQMRGKASLRIDTHQGNVVMRRMLEKQGFGYCGVIHLPSGAPRVAYERIQHSNVALLEPL